MEERTKFHVGLDVHKDSISVAAAEPGRAPGRLIGKVTHDVAKLLKVLAKIGTPEQLHIVYEAGPTGFGLEGLSESIRTTAWKAQLRLTQRFAALRDRGVQINKACVAIARELAGFIWAIGMQARQEEATAT